MDTGEMCLTEVSYDPLERSLEIDSIAIRRMVEEVRSNDPIAAAAAYNRTHNRHNR